MTIEREYLIFHTKKTKKTSIEGPKGPFLRLRGMLPSRWFERKPAT